MHHLYSSPGGGCDEDASAVRVDGHRVRLYDCGEPVCFAGFAAGDVVADHLVPFGQGYPGEVTLRVVCDAVGRAGYGVALAEQDRVGGEGQECAAAGVGDEY